MESAGVMLADRYRPSTVLFLARRLDAGNDHFKTLGAQIDLELFEHLAARYPYRHAGRKKRSPLALSKGERQYKPSAIKLINRHLSS